MFTAMRRAGVATAAAALCLVFSGVPASAAQHEGDWWRAALRVNDLHSITTGSGVLVGVLDTGVDASIPALAEAVEPGGDLTEHRTDGRTDHDGSFHGTGMALHIAGRGTTPGFGGLAPDASILPVTLDFNPSSGDDPFSEAIRFAVERGADVINISASGFRLRVECPERVAAAVRYAISSDVVVVASAGNEQGGVHEFPASCPGVLAVGATDQNGKPWEHSHRGSHVALTAPGVGIASVGPNLQVGVGDGTSSASAFVSGAVALIRAHYPEASADEVVTRLIATAEDLEEPGHDKATGYGLVRPYEALTADIPAGTENPVYAGLDLTDTEDPGPQQRETIAPPSIAAPPVAGGGDGGISPALVILPVAAVLVLATAVLITLLVLRSRRRDQIQTPPGYGYLGPGQQ